MHSLEMYVSAGHVQGFSLDSPLHLRVTTQPLSHQGVYVLAFLQEHCMCIGTTLAQSGTFSDTHFQTQMSHRRFLESFLGRSTLDTMLGELRKIIDPQDDRSMQALSLISSARDTWQSAYVEEYSQHAQRRSDAIRYFMRSEQPLPIPKKYFSSVSRLKARAPSAQFPFFQTPTFKPGKLRAVLDLLATCATPIIVPDYKTPDDWQSFNAGRAEYALSPNHRSWLGYDAAERETILRENFLLLKGMRKIM